MFFASQYRHDIWMAVNCRYTIWIRCLFSSCINTMRGSVLYVMDTRSQWNGVGMPWSVCVDLALWRAAAGWLYVQAHYYMWGIQTYCMTQGGWNRTVVYMGLSNPHGVLVHVEIWLLGQFQISGRCRIMRLSKSDFTVEGVQARLESLEIRVLDVCQCLPIWCQVCDFGQDHDAMRGACYCPLSEWSSCVLM